MKKKTQINRRDFLKLGLLTLSSLAFVPFADEGDQYREENLGRVATTQVSVYAAPSDSARIVYQRFRDELVHIYEEIVAEDGPGYNPLWYRVWGGYVHSAHIQRVKLCFNPVLKSIPEQGQLVQVTVPWSQVIYRKDEKAEWRNIYRLYYGSNHWVIGVEEGPDGEAWYRIQDDLTKDEYHAQARHLRPILADELQPINLDVPLSEKLLEVSIAMQETTAYEYGKVVRKMKISSGMLKSVPQGEVPTATPKGTFHITSKMPSKHMGGGQLTDDLEAYVLPGVPWVSFFETVTGVAFHGTYWHHNFGTTMSHGCINMTNEDARWVYLWSQPSVNDDQWLHKGFGTRVVVY
jgi:lipoprotein-anchoring transpeptidase ErfK/SrfK